jgi:putative transcriptional regulator
VCLEEQYKVVSEMNVVALGNNIANIRRKKNITQQELADEIGVVRTSLSHIENGLYAPSSETMIKISDALQEPLGDIFFNPNVLECNTEGLRREVI